MCPLQRARIDPRKPRSLQLPPDVHCPRDNFYIALQIYQGQLFRSNTVHTYTSGRPRTPLAILSSLSRSLHSHRTRACSLLPQDPHHYTQGPVTTSTSSQPKLRTTRLPPYNTTASFSLCNCRAQQPHKTIERVSPDMLQFLQLKTVCPEWASKGRNLGPS